MAEKRMFSKKIIDSDLFLDMPTSAQNLYFHLCMRADDDGFVDSPKKIQKMVGANDDDFKILVAKQFLLIFESGVIVIRHWRLHNTIASDRYKKTIHTDEKALIILDDNKMYTLCNTNCLQTGNVDKIRLDKISIDKASIISKKEVDTKRPVDNFSLPNSDTLQPVIARECEDEGFAALLTADFIDYADKIPDCPAKQILIQPVTAREYLNKYFITTLKKAMDKFIAKGGKHIKLFDIILDELPKPNSEHARQEQKTLVKKPRADCPKCKGEGWIFKDCTLKHPSGVTVECDCKCESE